MSWIALQIKWQECFRCVSDKIIIDWAVSPVLRGSDKYSVLVNAFVCSLLLLTPHGGYEKEFKFHIHSGMRQSPAGGSHVKWDRMTLRIKVNTEVLARIILGTQTSLNMEKLCGCDLEILDWDTFLKYCSDYIRQIIFIELLVTLFKHLFSSESTKHLLKLLLWQNHLHLIFNQKTCLAQFLKDTFGRSVKNAFLTAHCGRKNVDSLAGKHVRGQ